MIKKKLIAFQKKTKCTFLGVGPVSLNCVDVTIDLANRYEIPIFLIASRGQIDDDFCGGGYVNNWNTKKFSKYVKEKDKKNKIYLSRDHGGPWQNPKEVELNLALKQAMDSAKKSYLTDIVSGFKVIHIDPSIDIHRKPKIDEVLDRVYELYEYCWSKAKDLNKNITFEIGTEEQSGSTNSQEELEFTLSSVQTFCKKNNIPEPTFVVIQSGTKVLETSNVGSFDLPLRVANEIPAEIQLPKMIEICKKFNVMMKAHNTDYLSESSLDWHPRLGIHSANVAPEFGVTETKAFIKILKENKLNKLLDDFIKLSYQSGKWKKWMKPDSKAKELDKAIIAGHYVFAKKEFLIIKEKAKRELKKKDIDLDHFLKFAIQETIFKYLTNFRLVKNK